MTINDIEPALTQLYLRSICRPVQYIVRKDDKFILWKNLRHLKELIKYMQTKLGHHFTQEDVVRIFHSYLRGLGDESGPAPFTTAPSITEDVIYDVLQYKMDPASQRTVGRSWYPVFVVNMKLYDTPQTHPKYGEYVAWSTNVIRI